MLLQKSQGHRPGKGILHQTSEIKPKLGGGRTPSHPARPAPLNPRLEATWEVLECKCFYGNIRGCYVNFSSFPIVDHIIIMVINYHKLSYITG